MGNCGKCKHWDKGCDSESTSYYWQQKSMGLGVCTKVHQFWNATEWSNDEDAEDDTRIPKEKHKCDLAFVQDGSDYWALLLTKPEFGCVQFEEKAYEICMKDLREVE